MCIKFIFHYQTIFHTDGSLPRPPLDGDDVDDVTTMTHAVTSRSLRGMDRSSQEKTMETVPMTVGREGGGGGLG